MANESTSLNQRYISASDLASIQGDKRNNADWQNAGWLKKLAVNFGLQDIYDAADDFLTGRISQQRDYDLDQAKMDRQERFEREMWEKTNNYNSPENQLARWRAAGGNPNSYFGGGTNTGNASMASAPTGGGAAGSTIGVLANSIGTTANTLKSWWEARKTKAEAEGKEMENGTYMRRTEAEINQTIAQTKLAEKQGHLAKWQAKQIEELLPGLVGKTNAEIAQIKQTTKNLIEENEFIKERTKNLKQDTRNKILENEKLKWEKLFRDQYGVDPNSGPIQMLIQNILTGKGVNVLDTIWGYFEGDYGVDEFVDKLGGDRKYQKAKSIAQDLLFHNTGLAGVYYSAKRQWGRNNKERESSSHSFKF